MPDFLNAAADWVGGFLPAQRKLTAAERTKQLQQTVKQVRPVTLEIGHVLGPGESVSPTGERIQKEVKKTEMDLKAIQEVKIAGERQTAQLEVDNAVTRALQDLDRHNRISEGTFPSEWTVESRRIDGREMMRVSRPTPNGQLTATYMIGMRAGVRMFDRAAVLYSWE